MKAADVPVPTTYHVPDGSTSPKFGQAFASGCGGRLQPVGPTRIPGAFAAFGTPEVWPLLDDAQARGDDWYYGDHGCYRRGKFYRVTKNEYQHQPTEDQLQRARPDRFHSLCGQVAAEDWRTDGSTIVICPQSPVYMARFGLDAHEWCLDIARELTEYTDRSLIIRWKRDARTIEQDLHDAWAIITFSSASAVDALVQGVPVFTLAPWAMTAPMGLSDLAMIEQPARPANRLPFLWALAEQQWTLQEIAAGDAWRWLNPRGGG